MLELKTKQNLAREAQTLAVGNELVRYHNVTYIPADYETRDTSVVPAAERTMWMPLSRRDMQALAASQFDTLFANDGELSSFDFMVAQAARQENSVASSLLIRTPDGLRLLTPKGELGEPTGSFVPNTVWPMLNTDKKAKARVRDVFDEWLGSKEEAESLLFHLATALSPGWSAVKYVLLLGEGRNGKSVALKMLQSLLGRENVSNITRQHIAEQSPVVTELNGKLLNIIFDGRAEYLKDSGTEKSLIAGEPAPIRKLYDSTPTMVQTNALFIEGLNREPKSNDKSSALQKRLVRFQFPNVYPLDHTFERNMLNEESLGAFLSLLIDHYVKEEELAHKLAPTTKAIELQLEHMYVNSLALQFLKHVFDKEMFSVDSVIGIPVTKLVQMFQSWRIHENDLGTWAEPDVVALFNPILNTERRSVREAGKVSKHRVTTSLKPEAMAFIESLKGGQDDNTQAALVAE